jgi:hypothetical protein
MLEDLVGGLFEGIGWGVGGVAVAAAVFVGGPRAKPMVKTAIKGYLTATHRVRAAAAEASESLQDLYAEAKHEYESQLRHDGVSGTGSTASGPVNINIEHADESA